MSSIKSDIKILSFDLGAIYAYAYSSYTRSKNKFTVIKGETIDLNNFIKNASEFSNLCDQRRQKFMVFEKQITELINNLDIDIFASEDVFINPGRPQAFKSLIIYLDTLERLVISHRKQLLHKIAPRSIKMNITGSGEADKITIQRAIINNPHISFRKNAIMNTMTSHLADAIACGYAIATEISSPLC